MKEFRFSHIPTAYPVILSFFNSLILSLNIMLKSLLKDTALYGITSIFGRFLNYLLVPLYTATMSAASGQYGIVTNLYAYTALILVCLTFGMETTFFRFANKEEENPMHVYSTALLTVGGLSVLFLGLITAFLSPLAGALGYAAHPEFLLIMAIIVAIDSFACIPFGYLRYQKKARKFCLLKLINILVNIGLNLFVFLLCPRINASHPEWISWFYDSEYLAGYVFAINLITSVVTLLMLAREWMPFGKFYASNGEQIPFRYIWDRPLFSRMFRYSYPVLILGVAGILNQTIDKIIYPFLVPGDEGVRQLGIYGAAAKIAMIMAMFTQAFRYAYEPMIFNKSRDKDDVVRTNALGMKYFIIFTLLGFLCVMAWIEPFKILLIRNQDYWEGLCVVPIVMAAEIMMGIYFNLSFWYKLIDKTLWGALFSVIGCAVLVTVNVLFVPTYGYIACAWAGFAGYATCMLLSYFVGQRKNPIPYDLRSIGSYTLLAAALYVSMTVVPAAGIWSLVIKTAHVIFFCAFLCWKDFPVWRMIRKR